MFSGIKDHPFAVEAFFKFSLVLTFAFPKEQLQPFIPECLELDVFDDRWAFLAVAVVDTKNLRPKGFPEFMGHDFILAGYRIFVKYNAKNGKRLRGLYIVRSETDKQLMKLLGDLFTHYKYERTNIHISLSATGMTVDSNHTGLFIRVEDNGANIPLP